MATKRSKWKNGLRKDAYDILANPIASVSLNDEQYSEAINRFVHREKDGIFDERFGSLNSKSRFSQAFNAAAKSIERFAAHGMFGGSVSTSRLASIYRITFITRQAELVEFCRLRRQYENSTLRGDYDDADSKLELSREKLGESLWYIRCKFSTLISRGKFDELEQFSKNCKDRSSSELISLILRYSLLLESNPTLHFERIVMRTIRTLDEANLKGWGGILRLLFCPVPLTCFPDTQHGFHTLQAFSLIDQFTLLEKYINESIAADEKQGDPFNFKAFYRSVSNLANDIDADTSNIALQEITLLYEQGEYLSLLEKFVNNFESIEVPFSVLNIVAKAVASDSTIPLPFPKGALNSIIQALVRIYRLDASPTTLEEDFTSLAIKFHHFKGAHCLQLALFKALPHRYDMSRTTWIAKAAAEESTGTPLSTALAFGQDPILEYRYLSEEKTLTQQRQIKSEIRRTWISQDHSLLPSMLESYKKKSALPKDYVELASSYYLKSGKFDELLAFSAYILSENQRMYVALPIEKIVEFAVGSKLSTLESIIVFNTYVKFVDSQREHILHEAFEEYLISNNVDRPTELLKGKTNIPHLEMVFFRDISIVETMDYLSCFNSSNELRSERVKILDELRDRRLISPENHREEVDEIIGQVVVDAGAAEFSTNKIEVNTAALKRQILPDVNSMLLLYRSLSSEEKADQKTISVTNAYGDDDGDVEKLRALVAGDRNTALLRLLVLIYDAFLSDEKFGLDKNLSTEIRHGFFANLMRSRLEEHKLITEIDESGKYKSNQYWRDANAILIDETLDEVDTHLAHFSQGINELIEKAEEWMKVSRTPNPDRVFIFEIYVSALEQLHPVAEKCSADEFVDVCFNTLWHLVEIRLAEIREKLNVHFKDAIDKIFDELLESIEITRMNFPMTDLIGTIIQVKSGIREDITSVSEWFKRSESGTAALRSVEELVKISLECFYRVRGTHLNCTIDLPESMKRVQASGQNAKAFIVIFVNLLENACRGSGLGTETPISIHGLDNGSSWEVSLRNEMSKQKFGSIPEGYLSQLDEKMRSPLSIPLMRREGGSGLAKVFNQLNMIDDHFDVKLDLIDDPVEAFEVRIVYETRPATS